MKYLIRLSPTSLITITTVATRRTTLKANMIIITGFIKLDVEALSSLSSKLGLFSEKQNKNRTTIRNK